MNLLFLDTETGGLDPDKHSLLEVGLLAVKDHKIIGEYDTFIRHSEYHIDMDAMQYNGLDLMEIWKTGKAPDVVVQEITDFIHEMFGDEEVILAGHNLFLDRRMMNKLYADNGLNFSTLHSHRMLDTMGILYALNVLGKIPSTALGIVVVCEHLGIEAINHRALGDCKSTFMVYEKALELLGGAQLAAIA